MKSERRLALHDALVSAVKSGATVRLSTNAARELHAYLLELEQKAGIRPDGPPALCPLCNTGSLLVDEEYMLSTHGSAYEHMPWQQWTFYCDGGCEEAGPWSYFQKDTNQ